jgi:hypothetical protein
MSRDPACQHPPIRSPSMERRIESGDQLRCPHCSRWHTLVPTSSPGTDTGSTMLYFECRGLTYFGGFIGAGSRHETRNREDR